MIWRDVLIDPPPDGKRCLVRWSVGSEMVMSPFNPCIARASYVTGYIGIIWSFEPNFVAQSPNEWMEIPK